MQTNMMFGDWLGENENCENNGNFASKTGSNELKRIFLGYKVLKFSWDIYEY